LAVAVRSIGFLHVIVRGIEMLGERGHCAQSARGHAHPTLKEAALAVDGRAIRI